MDVRGFSVSTTGRQVRVVGAIGAALAGLGALALGLAPAASGSIAAASRPAAAHFPAGVSGQITAIAAVPHSSDLWALVLDGTTSCASGRFYLLHRHHGHWTKVKAPNIGHCGELTSIVAASAHDIILGGGRTAEQIQNIPSVYRSTGGKFTRMKTPQYCDGASDVQAVTASSPSNIWAAGAMWPCPANSAQAMLHWRGKSCASVAFPNFNNDGIRSISTSAANNAWALNVDGTILQWKGSSWVQNGTPPTGDQLNAIATGSPKLAYLVGAAQNPTTFKNSPVILRYDGTKWAPAGMSKGLVGIQLQYVAMHGKTAWAIGSRYNSARDTNHPVVMRSTGGAWSVLKNTLPKNVTFDSLSAVSSSHAFIGGAIENEAARTVKTLVIEVSGNHLKLLSSHP